VRSLSINDGGFLVVSNSRCGSTWLGTALGNIDGVEVDFETKIDVDNPYSWHSVHFPISSHSIDGDLANLKVSVLKAASATSAGSESTVWGSKLVLDPYRPTPFCHSSALEERMILLDNVISHGVAMGFRFVHLTRDICDQEMSRGGHTPSRRTLESDTSNELIRAIGTRSYVEYDQKFVPHRCGSEARTRMAYDLVIARALVRHRAETIEVAYEDLAARFGEVASFVGAQTQFRIDELQATDRNRHRVILERCCVGESLTRTSKILRKNLWMESDEARSGDAALNDLGPFIQVAIEEWADLALSQGTWLRRTNMSIRGRLRLRSRAVSLFAMHPKLLRSRNGPDPSFVDRSPLR
jgi:hypothetical protein